MHVNMMLVASLSAKLQGIKLEQYHTETPGLETPTVEVNFKQLGDLIQQQRFQVDLAKPLLKTPCTVSNDLDHFVHKNVIRRDLRVPCLHELLYDHRDNAI
jgi:hypothetical protein